MQIMEEVGRRAEVLRLMQKSGRFPDIASVTKFCQRYSDAPAEALSDLGTSEKELNKQIARK